MNKVKIILENEYHDDELKDELYEVLIQYKKHYLDFLKSNIENDSIYLSRMYRLESEFFELVKVNLMKEYNEKRGIPVKW